MVLRKENQELAENAVVRLHHRIYRDHAIELCDSPPGIEGARSEPPAEGGNFGSSLGRGYVAIRGPTLPEGGGSGFERRIEIAVPAEHPSDEPHGVLTCSLGRLLEEARQQVVLEVDLTAEVEHHQVFREALTRAPRSLVNWLSEFADGVAVLVAQYRENVVVRPAVKDVSVPGRLAEVLKCTLTGEDLTKIRGRARPCSAT